MQTIAPEGDRLALPAPAAVALVAGAAVAAVALGSAISASERATTAMVLLVGAATFAGLVWLALRRFVDFLAAIFVIRAALDYTDGRATIGPVDPPAVFGVVFLALGIGWLWTEWRRGALVRASSLTVALVCLAGIALVNPVFAVSPADAAQSGTKVAAMAVMAAVLEQVFRRDPDLRRRFLRAVPWSMILPAVVGLAQLASGESTVDDRPEDYARISGTFVHPNAFATYLGVALVVALLLRSDAVGRRRTVYGAVAAGASILLLFTYTRSAWGAVLVGVLFFAVERDRSILRLLAVGGVLLVLFVPSVVTRIADLGGEQPDPDIEQADSLSWRVRYWNELVPLGLHAPIGGIGLEGARLTDDEGYAPHSVFVQAFVETGVPGSVALVATIGAAAGAVYRARRFAVDEWERTLGAAALAVAVPYLAQMFTENLLTQVVTFWYLLLVLTAASANGWRAGVAPEGRGGWLVARRLLSSRGAVAPSLEPLDPEALRRRVADLLARTPRVEPGTEPAGVDVRAFLAARSAPAPAPAEVSAEEAAAKVRATLERARGGFRA